MSKRQQVAPSADPARALVKAIAMDIGKEVVAHIRTMYPQAIAACPKSTFPLSVRNCVHNEIMAALDITDEGQIIARLHRRKKHRDQIAKAYRKIRRPA